MLETLLDQFSADPNTLLTGGLYLALGGTYLVAMPLFVYVYLIKRWYTCGSIERFFMYSLVFVFFPGLLLFSPFLNLRPRRRSIKA